MVLIKWNNLHRRRYQPKDEVDIQGLAAFGDRFEHFLHISHILHNVGNNVEKYFHIPRDMVIQYLPLERIIVFKFVIPLEMLHDIVMLSCKL